MRMIKYLKNLNLPCQHHDTVGARLRVYGVCVYTIIAVSVDTWFLLER